MRRVRRIDPTARRTGADLLEALTWSPRRIRLIPGAGGRCAISDVESPILVRAMYFTAGDSCDFQWNDPHVAYVATDERTTPVRPREDRDPWRDVGALALLDERKGGGNGDAPQRARPPIVSQFATLSAEVPDAVGPELDLRLYGMRTDLKMKVYEWIRQSLELPTPLVLREALYLALLRGIEEAEHVHQALSRALLQAMSVGGRRPNSEAKALTRSSRIAFWAGLELPFQQLSRALGGVDPEREPGRIDAALTRWRDTIVRDVERAFDASTQRLRWDADHLAAIERARATLSLALLRLREPAPR